MAVSTAVIGGGIGGLAAALTLLRAGCDVHVYEQTSALRDIGAGIQMVARLPAERLHVGHRVTHLTNHTDRVVAHFENGRSIAADALVGADGIHSTVRRVVFGDENAQFTGCVAYRGLVDAGRQDPLSLAGRTSRCRRV